LPLLWSGQKREIIIERITRLHAQARVAALAAAKKRNPTKRRRLWPSGGNETLAGVKELFTNIVQIRVRPYPVTGLNLRIKVPLIMNTTLFAYLGKETACQAEKA
jgi:hypothetical protein